MQTFVDLLHSRGQRWVPILDPCIHIRKGYAPYDSGIAQDVFIKDITGKPYVGQVSGRRQSQHSFTEQECLGNGVACWDDA